MRGKGLPGFDEIMNAGITPAYAGKRAQRRNLETRLQDHPRVCGEKDLQLRHGVFGLGSPPRMRGKVTYDDDHVPGMRITPAYAGKSSKEKIGQQELKDHPRVCGEK